MAALAYLREFHFGTVLLRLLFAFLCGGARASMTGLYLYLNAGLSTDISRIGASVVSGLGFIGVAVGGGYYEGGIAATVLILLTESCFTGLSKRIPYTPEFCLTLRYCHKLALDQVLRYCKDKHLGITDLQVTSHDADAGYDAVISLRARGKLDMERLLEHIRGIPEILDVEER